MNRAVHEGLARSAPISNGQQRLEPPPALFFNRDALLGRLADAVARHPHDGGPLVVVLVGPSGIGKRTLALRFLHQTVQDAAPGRFAAGTLQEILLGGGAGFARDAGAVLEDWLAGWGMDAIPAELAGKSAKFRDATAGHPVAMLLVDAPHAAAVRHLLPSSAASVVVVTTTSRAVASGLSVSPGALVETLDVLDETASRALLTAKAYVHAPAWLREADLRTALDACDGHALALCLVGTRLADDGPDWAADTLAALADARRRLEVMAVPDDLSVRAALDVCYRRLPPRSQDLFRALGALPVQVFDLAAAVDLADGGSSAADVRADLAQLAGESLLDRAAHGRYRLQRVILDRARELAEAEPETDSPGRRMRLFGGVTERAEASCASASARFRYGARPAAGPVYADEAQALDALEADRPLLLAAVRSAAELGDPVLACRAFQALHELVQHRNLAEEVLGVASDALAAADDSGDPLWSARTHYEIGFTRLERNDPTDREAAAAHFTEALRHASGVSDAHRRTRSTAQECLGVLAYRNREYAQAQRLFQDAISALGDIDHPRGMAILYLHIGRAHFDLRELPAARESFETGLALTAEVPDAATPRGTRADNFNRAKILTELARVRTALGDRGQALADLAVARELMSAHKSWAPAGDIVYYAAQLHRDEGEFTSARTLGQEALSLFELAGSRRTHEARSFLESLEGLG